MKPSRRAANTPSSTPCLARRVGALACAALLFGCAAGPDFKRPESPAATHYAAGADPATAAGNGIAAQRFAAGADLPGDWWRLFESPELDALVAAGLAHSPTLEAARATLAQSEENLRAGRGVFFPELDIGASFARQQISPLRFGPGAAAAAPVFGLYTLSVGVGYALDVFGTQRRGVEGLAAEVDAGRAAARAAMLSLVGNIINTAIAEAAYREQGEALQRLLILQRQQLALLRTQAESGLVGDAAVVALEAQLAANEAVLPTLRQRRSAAADLLATLTGQLPADAALPPLTLASLRLPATLPLSVPSALVRHRPDILAAEAELHYASAQIGVASAALYPSITLGGNYGANNDSLRRLRDPAGRFWSFGPSVDLPLFQGGAGVARKQAAVEAYAAALARYRQTVLAAFAQVADTLQALTHDAELAQARQRAYDLAQEQLALTRASRDAGLVADADWLVAQQQLESARLSLVDATAQRHQDSAALFVALGGGWWNAPCGRLDADRPECAAPAAKSADRAARRQENEEKAGTP